MWGSIITSASAGLQAIEGNSAIRNAEKRQQEWQERAMKVKEENYNKAMGYYDPYSKFGGSAMDRLNAMRDPGYTFDSSDPSYDWRVKEGQKGYERSAAARGNLVSGSALKGLEAYRQGLASTEYGNEWKRNMDEMGVGQQADFGKAGMTNAYGDWMAGANQDIGNIQANAIMARYKNWAAQDSRAAGAWASYFGSQDSQASGGSGNYGSMGRYQSNNYNGISSSGGNQLGAYQDNWNTNTQTMPTMPSGGWSGK